MIYLDIPTASQRLKAGHVVAIPTETVYGLAASLHSSKAIEQVFTLKGRPSSHPLIIHMVGQAMLHEYAENIPAYVQTLLNTFCPGPLTLILTRSEKVSPIVTGGQNTVGIRFPAHPVAQALIDAVGHPLAAPSANRFGRISPTCAEHVFSEFGELVNIVDGGICDIGIESTIVDATHPDHCAILRHGTITHHALETALGTSTRLLHEPLVLRPVSGSLKQHYAPVKPAFLFKTEAEKLALKKRFPQLTILPLLSNPSEYAKQLYQRLRLADGSPSEAIAIETPPSTPLWAAINDRLSRACTSFCYDEENITSES